MKSVYVVFPEKEHIRVESEELPAPASGEILCAAERSLISLGTESFCLRGEFDPGTNWEAWTQYPFRPGYSMAARVIAVGSEVKGWHIGDRVAAWSPHQQYFSANPNQLLPIPKGISDEDAAWATLATTAQLGVRRARMELGERAAVVGMGILGQLVVQYLALSGCAQVIAIDRNPMRLKMARAHGASSIIASDVKEARAGIELLTRGSMLEVVFDVTGNAQGLAPATQLLRPMGRLILLGDTPTPSQQHLGPSVVSHSLAILGVHSLARPLHGSELSPWGAREMVSLFFDYLQQGRMKVSDLITHRFSPLDAPTAYGKLRAGHASALGAIFDWSLLDRAV